jgi:all-trans-retinol 13,14-reductase
MFSSIISYIFCVNIFIYLVYLLITLGTKRQLKNKKFKQIKTANLDSNKTEYNKDRFTHSKIPNNVDVIVIGSGIGGLTSAALLAKTGKTVLVLEQHYIAGGTLHSFVDKGVEHETGLHYIGNIKKRIPILNLITDRELDWSKLGWERNDNRYVYDEIIIGDKRFEFEAGVNNLKKYLMKEFPNEKEYSFDLYFELIAKASGKTAFFITKIIPYKFLSNLILYFDKDFHLVCSESAHSIVSKIFKDPLLISVLLGQFGDYGITPKKASFFIHACIVNHYLEGGWFPRGGTGEIANQICKTIKRYGGQVLVGKGVKMIHINNDGAYGVRMEGGLDIFADTIISGVGVRNTFKRLVPPKYTPTVYNEILDNIPPSVQHMYCFVKLKGSPSELNLTSSNMWIYPHGDYDKLIKDFLDDPYEAPIPLFMGFSCQKDEDWEQNYPGYSNAIILTQVDKDMFNDWENSKCMKRGFDYKMLKEQIGERMLEEGLFKYFPNLRNKVVDVSFGTPLSTQFYLNTYHGESYGLDMNEYRLLDTNELRPKTSINNLYLTGQDICTLGVTGAMMGGVLTANVVAGYDNLIDLCMGNNIVKDLEVSKQCKPKVI